MDGIDAEYQWYIMPVNDTVYWWDINGIEYNGILMEYLYREIVLMILTGISWEWDVNWDITLW